MAYEPIGLVVGKFAPPHLGHGLLIETALGEMDYVVVLVYSNPDFPGMPSSVRARWLQDLYPTALVFAPEDPPSNTADDDTHREYVKGYLERIKDRLPYGSRVDVVYTSEGYGEGFAQYLRASHREVDRERRAYPVSGTRVRADLHGERRWLEPRVYRHLVERVVLLGAESTGKSSLAERLAAEYATSFVPEYGRTLWEEKGGRLTFPDFLTIARVHREHEDEAVLGAHHFLFCDTNALTTAMYSHLYERRCDPELLRLALECRERYRHVLVCDDDFPFVQDGTRMDGRVRAVHQSLVIHDLAVRGIPYAVLSGSLEERVARARAVLEGGRPLEG